MRKATLMPGRSAKTASRPTQSTIQLRHSAGEIVATL